MAYNTAIVSGRLEKQEPAVVAETLRSMIRDNLTIEAGQVFQRYREIKPDNFDLAISYVDILLKAGEINDAEKILAAELQKEPERFDLLFRLGRLDEIRGQNLDAFDLFQQAAFLAGVHEEKQMVQKALTRVKEKIKSEVVFKTDSFTINLKGNSSPLTLQYNLEQLKERRALLEALLAVIDPRAKTVIEIECDAGVITRNLAGHGFKTEGTASEMTDIILAMGFEYVEMLRKAASPSPNYYQIDINEDTLQRMDKSDVILVLPTRCDWYTRQGPEAAAALLKQLSARSKRQLFFSIPGTAGAESSRDLALALTGALGRDKEHPVKAQLCFESDKGGFLYRIDQRQAGDGDLKKLLPAGLDAVGSRSSIFEVDIANCCSLNGFGFAEEGWNHFTALLEELLTVNNFSYKDSILKRFYDSFQPQSRQEQLFAEATGPISPLDRGWTLLPWVDTKNRRFNPVESPVLNSGGNPHYGPNSEEFGLHVCKKLLATYTLLKEFGYMPEVFPDGYIQGYFLKDGKDYRFYVNEGQHRMASLALLGYKRIKARYNPDFIPVVDLKTIKNWPQVRRGLYSEDVARKVFGYYFEENGSRKAKQLGLL